MKLISLLALAMISTASFADQINLECKTVLNGNKNGKAFTDIKTVDATITIDTDAQNASIRGKAIVKASKVYKENDTVDLYEGFMGDRKVTREGTTVKLTSYDKGFILMCGTGISGPCRLWNSISWNYKTGEVNFEQAYSYKKLVGGRIEQTSAVFSCTKI